VDVLYTRATHQWYFSPANLPAPVDSARGEGNRLLYGTINTSGVATPAWLVPVLGQVVRVSDRSGDRSLTLSVQVRKRLGDRAELNALYAHTRAQDRMSSPTSRRGPTCRTRPSMVPWKVDACGRRTSRSRTALELSAAVRLPYRSDSPSCTPALRECRFTYTVTGDCQRRRYGTAQPFFNDIVYVPRDRTESDARR